MAKYTNSQKVNEKVCLLSQFTFALNEKKK